MEELPQHELAMQFMQQFADLADKQRHWQYTFIFYHLVWPMLLIRHPEWLERKRPQHTLTNKFYTLVA